jgi:hypothetical protein
MAFQTLQSTLQLANFSRHQSPIRFELSFAGTAQPDTAFLPLQMSPSPHETRGHVLHLSQLNLQLALKGTGALRKNIENETGPINDAAPEHAFEISLLGCTQGVINKHEFSA